MNAIEVQDLTRFYGKHCAVDHINFTVAAGETFGFLGPNGAGKTTTIKLLTGQLRPHAGQGRIFGYDIERQRGDLKPLIGVTFERQNIYERMSTYDNLHFCARLYGVPQARIDDVLAQVGLTEKAGARAGTLSNGQKQRLLIARALLHEPRLLFLDEPTKGLDPGVARDIRNIVADLRQQGVTVFLTTHYMEEADRLCDRVAILDEGRIVALDSPADLKASWAEPESSLESVFLALTERST